MVYRFASIFASICVAVCAAQVAASQELLCDTDFDNNGYTDPVSDLAAFQSVFSEGLCPTANCDSIDFNGDGAVFDPADLDAFRVAVNGGPCPNGWYPVPKWPGAEWIHLDPQAGEDTGNASREQPVRSVKEAHKRAQDAANAGRPWAVIIPRGTVVGEGLLGEYGAWTVSGSAKYPAFIAADPLDDPARPRPIIQPVTGGDGALFYAGNIRLIGLDVRNETTQAGRRGNGAKFYGNGSEGRVNIVVDDCAVTGFGGGLVFQGATTSDPIRNVVVNRSSVVGSWSADGHSQGAFASAVHGIRWSGVTLYANGFSIGNGASATIYNHGYYGVANVRECVWSNSVAVENSATGWQLRGGSQSVTRSVAINNPLGITGGHDQAGPNDNWTGSITGSLVIGGGDISGQPRSFSIGINRASGAAVVGNIIWRVAPESIGADAGSVFWLQGPSSQSWTVANNIIYDPRLVPASHLSPVAVRDDRQQPRVPALDALAGNDWYNAEQDAWAPPSLVDYLNENGVHVFAPEMAGRAFAVLASQNRRGAWQDAWTAEALITWWRSKLAEDE
jgi:hypothetical protein